MAMNDEERGHVDAIYDWSTRNDNTQRASDILFGISIHSDPTKSQIIDLSYSAMDELSMIGNLGEPLWQPQNQHRHQTLNKREYLRQFGQMDDTLRDIIKLVEVGQLQSLSNLDSYLCEHSMLKKPTKNEEALQVEGSRDMEYIKMSASDIVELLMDMNQWSREFFNIVSTTTMVGTLLDGAEGNNDGKLHVVS
ncbi:putative START domain-containing protein [Lupinus albus]|uniref:Putative START domain-containing protein n=1 Tax=Lupinus albus TaxID=3870 RepID=A0A6A4QU35_LUPAL|nr:putative START domain-containing protein [Lupinus albus]